MENYSANSHKVKEENAIPKKDVRKVVSGTVQKKRHSLIADVLLDEAEEKKNTIIENTVNIVLDSISNIIIDAVRYSIGGRSENRTGSGMGHSQYVSYNRFSSDNREDLRTTRTARTGYSFDDIILPSKAEAEEVLYNMEGLLVTYKAVTVADLYDLVGITPAYTDNKYGWTNLRNAQSVRTHSGYMLRLPRPMPLD